MWAGVVGVGKAAVLDLEPEVKQTTAFRLWIQWI